MSLQLPYSISAAQTIFPQHLSQSSAQCVFACACQHPSRARVCVYVCALVRVCTFSIRCALGLRWRRRCRLTSRGEDELLWPVDWLNLSSDISRTLSQLSVNQVLSVRRKKIPSERFKFRSDRSKHTHNHTHAYTHTHTHTS